jgi:hypothetical protein
MPIVRRRAIVAGVLLGLAICAFSPYSNAYLKATPLGGGHFPLAPFFIVVWLAAGSALWGRLVRGDQRRGVLTGRELLVVWVLMVAVSGLGYTGLVRTLLVNLTAPLRFATPGNRWAETLQPLLPAGLYPSDRGAVAALYDGLEGGRAMSWPEVLASLPWAAWAGPLLAWGVFILLGYLVMLCLTDLLSRQWIERERMNFPLLRAPQLMAEALDQGQLGGFLADRWFLAGLLIPVLLHTVNGLAFYLPSVPQIPTVILAGKYFGRTGLFAGFVKLKLAIYPAFIGFAFLAARQISLSFWLFFLLGGLSVGALGLLGYQIPASALGTTFGPGLTRPEDAQTIGAYGVFFLFIVWLARVHLLGAARAALGRGGEAADPEWFSQGLAVRLAVVGLAGLTAWLAWFGLGIVPSLAVLAAFFMVMVVAVRIVCQGGIPYFTLTAAPLDGLIGLFGSGWLGQTGLLVSAAAQKSLYVDLRESLMPSLMHAAKVGEGVRNRRLIVLGLTVAVVAGAAVSVAAMLALCYKFGIRELQLDWAMDTTLAVYEDVQRLIEAPGQARGWTNLFSGVGAVVMLGLILGYQRLHWWPLHPVGYLTAYSTAMQLLWFSFFVGWLCNHLALRYGGVGLLLKLRLLFVGLIVGDFLMGGLWAAYGFWAGASYQVLPN